LFQSELRVFHQDRQWRNQLWQNHQLFVKIRAFNKSLTLRPLEN
jgi:hypothetical protein